MCDKKYFFKKSEELVAEGEEKGGRQKDRRRKGRRKENRGNEGEREEAGETHRERKRDEKTKKGEKTVAFCHPVTDDKFRRGLSFVKLAGAAC